MSHEPTAQEIHTTQVYRSVGLRDEEYIRICDRLGRLPNWVELGLFSVLWSEHCSYKSSRATLRRFPTSGPRVLQGPGENAGVIDIGDDLAIAFKMESHNHPSAIEPFQGAATGVGGILRDVFTMGARPIAILDSLRFGPPDDEHQRYLVREVVAGIAGYGNAIGVPTVGGETLFAERYRDNPLVNAMCVGLLRHDQLARGTASGVGNPVLAVGARTGRDGIHGATFASAEDPHAKERSAVQVGDPFLEKLLLEACLELIATGIVVGIQDMGAAGLTSSSAEMASRAGSGLELDIARVPRRETGMTPYEVMLSESQERMLVVVRRGAEPIAEAIFHKWELEVATIGHVTDNGLLRLTDGETVVAEVPVAALVDEAPVYTRPARESAEYAALRRWDTDALPQPTRLDVALLDLLATPSLASKAWIWRQYDHMVQASTVVRPGADAAVVWLRGTRKGIAMATDGQARYVGLNPLLGGMHAVAEVTRNLVCVGAEPLAITDCLNFGNPEKPEIMYQFVQAVEGISQACEALGTPVVSGNVSFYNESRGVAIDPSPILGAVGLVEDIDQTCTPAWHDGDAVILLGPPAPTLDAQATWLGASEYAALHGVTGGDAPPLDLDMERRVQMVCLSAIRAGRVAAAHDVSEGGLAVGLAEMALASQTGATLDLRTLGAATRHVRPDALLFGEAGSRILLAVAADQTDAVLALAATAHIPATLLGAVGGTALTIQLWETKLRLPVAQAAKTWREALPCALGETALTTQASR